MSHEFSKVTLCRDKRMENKDWNLISENITSCSTLDWNHAALKLHKFIFDFDYLFFRCTCYCCNFEPNWKLVTRKSNISKKSIVNGYEYWAWCEAWYCVCLSYFSKIIYIIQHCTRCLSETKISNIECSKQDM